MGGQETISVAEVSDGQGGTGTPGEDVSLPVVEVLTGRAFITGKSGSGKSNTASVVIEKLLDASFPVLIVDIDGEYYGLKEKYEILHVGDDEECDIQVNPEHAEKIASLALEENVPIILDVSSFLDEEESKELLTAVARQLFAKEKKLKKPFLMLVEEIHEYLPEGGGLDECGKMLIKIGKRGRKHGLGIAGISQRPADVKKDFITQCDWLVWHRLTWNNDTKVVRRVLDGEYAAAVEDLDDGEGFMMTDWSETVRRVQFHRKQTFDAGATPGLDDFERPELKSVSEDLVSELATITEEEQAREDRIKELREELDKKNSRIAELETELQDARDMQRMAEQFTQALLNHVDRNNPGWTEQERMRNQRVPSATDPVESAESEAGGGDAVESETEPERDAAPPDDSETGDSEPTSGSDDEAVAESVAEAETDADDAASDRVETAEATVTDEDGAMEMTTAMADGPAPDEPETDGAASNGSAATDESGVEFVDETSEFSQPVEDDAEIIDADARTNESDTGRASDSESGATETTGSDFGSDSDFDSDTGSEADGFEPSYEPFESEPEPSDSFESDDFGSFDGERVDTTAEDDAASADGLTADVDFGDISHGLAAPEDAPDFDGVDDVHAELQSLDAKTCQMLRFYRDQGPGTPMDARFSAGGSNDRTDAYARNRQLRVRGFVEHVGRGRYDYTLPELVASVADDEAGDALDRLERTVLSAGEN
jgi:hypothetical protein